MSELVRDYRLERERLQADFARTADVSAFLAGHSAVIDAQVTAIARRRALLEHCALCALGGYGRAEMFPYSDIDILVLIPENHDEALDAQLSGFITELWDLGLTVGSSVRTLSQMRAESSQDITVSTAFLESRLIGGREDLYEATREAFLSELNPRSFFVSKMLEMRQRHQRHADTPYALEPNIKESPGGIRDLQVFLWCARVAGFGDSWQDLSRAGLVTEAEARHLTGLQENLYRLRLNLHLLARRHEDRLLFDLQTPMATAFGISAQDSLLPSEVLMKRYYRIAHETSQLSAIMIETLSDRLFADQFKAQVPVPIAEHYEMRGDVLDIRDPGLFGKFPIELLNVFGVFASHSGLTRFSSRLMRALWSGRSLIDENYRADEANKNAFLSLVRMERGSSQALRMMTKWGILGRFLPSFERICGQMQHDLFHAYTVDQHTMRTVIFLRRFTHSSYAHEFPLCSQIASEMPKPWRLTLAGLFHDIAKGRGGNHSELGESEFRGFAEQFGLNGEDTEFIAFLIREHLTMSRIAQREDTSDPDVIARMARIAASKERLDALYLLTVADIRATSPKVWNAWKAQLLESLYLVTSSLLSGKKRTIKGRQKKVEEILDADGFDPEAARRFMAQLDLVYFMRHRSDDIVWHVKSFALNAPDQFPQVAVRMLEKDGCIEVAVRTPDEKDLFLRVVKSFESLRLSVVSARVHTTRDGWALDTFLLSDLGARENLSEITPAIIETVTRFLTQKKPLAPPKPGRASRRGRAFPTPIMVDIEQDESRHGWRLQIVCADRLGLLYAIAHVLARHNINLQTARIATLGERVEDSFLISGEALKHDDTTVAVENELLKAVSANL